MNAPTSKSPAAALRRILTAILLAVIAMPCMLAPAVAQQINTTPEQCCECVKLEILEVPSVDKAGSPLPRFAFDEKGQRAIKVKVLRETSASCVVPLTQALTGQVLARSHGSSGKPKSEQTFTIPPNAMASQELIFNFDTEDAASGNGDQWEFALKCKDVECGKEPFLLGSGCSSCDQGGVCPVDVESGCFSVSIPTLRSKGGMSSGTLHFFTPDFSFPGRAGLRANLPASYVVTKDGIGITQINTGSGVIEVADVAGGQAFTVTHKDVVGNAIRTTTIAMVTEAGVQRLRVDSTFDGSTTRQEQTQPTTGTLVLEKGHVEAGSFEPLWRETYVKTTVSAGLEKQRRTIEERASISHAWATTSDIETTYEKQVYDWVQTKQVIDPSGAALTTTWTYYQPGETTGPGSSTKGLGRLKRVVRHDGYEALYTYGQYSQSVTTPYANSAAGQTTTTTWDPGSQSETVITTVGGQTLSKTVTSHTPTSESQTVYTSAGGTLTTVTTFNPSGQDFGGKPVKVEHPDGTLTTYAYTREAGGGYTTVMDRGAGSSGTVTQGTRTTTTTNSRGTTILSKTEAIGYGTGSALFACTAVTAVDSVGRALTTAHYPTSASASGEQASASGAAWTTSRQYSCCGVANETDMYGITTYYAYDGLKRQIKTNRLGVTTETVRNGLTTESHRYAETVSGSLSPTLNGTTTTLVGKSIRNLAGTLSESWSPDPTNGAAGALVKSSSTAITYKPAAGLSSRSVTSVPDPNNANAFHIQTTDSFLDGKTAANYGELSPAMAYSYSVNATGEVSSRSYVDGSNLRETTTSQQDWAGRTLSTSYMDGAVSTMIYNSLGQMVKSTDPDGVTTLMAYNAEGEQTITAADLNANGAIDYGVDTVSYSETNPALAGSNPVFLSISKIWQPGDTNANGGTVVSTSQRSANGLSSSSQSIGVANPSTSETALAGAGNWTTTIAPDGTKQVASYTAGRMASTSLLNTENLTLETHSYGYDSLNRPITTTDSRTGLTATAYLSATADIVVSTTDPGNRTTSFVHDIRGRQISVDAPDTVDANGNALTNVTTTSYNPDGTVAETAGDQTYRTTHGYDYADRQVSMTTYGTEQATTTWTYSGTRGFLTRKQYADGNGTNYTYTGAGRLATRTWARGNHTRYHYDNGGRLTHTRYFLTEAADTGTNVGNDTATPDVSATYDALGRQVTQFNGLATTSFSYDAATLQLDTETIAYDFNLDNTVDFTRVIDRSYDNFQRATGWQMGTVAQYSSGWIGENNVSDREHHVAYAYGMDGRLATVSSGSGTFNYAYLANSGLVSTVSGPAHMVANSWDATRDVLLTKKNHLGITTISQYDYTVNPLGQRINVSQTGTAFAASRAIAWAYDNLGQVVQADSSINTDDRSYQYDGIGNRLKSADSLNLPAANNYSPNVLNQYAATPYGTAGVPPAYDWDGNMTSGPLPANPTAHSTLAWDAENRLIASTVHGVTTTYQYDSQSRRIAKTTNGATTVFVYDGWNPIAQYSIQNSTSNIQHSYLWGMDLSGSMQGAGGVGGLLAVKIGSNTFYPTFDGNGNVSEYLDSASAVTAHFEYDPFGREVVNTDSRGIFNHRFSTKQIDPETGLAYYGYRWYDPENGRWPSRDPIEERGGINLYGFVGNNGVNNVDVLGLRGGNSISIIYRNEIQSLKTLWNEIHSAKDSGYDACKQAQVKYLDYLERLSALQKKVSDYTYSQFWLTRNYSLFEAVAALPVTTNFECAKMTKESSMMLFKSNQYCCDAVEDDWINQYGDYVENGTNLVGGFADGISFGTSGLLAETVYGEGSWTDEESGWYTGGYWTGVATTTIAGGWVGVNRSFATKSGYFWGGAGQLADDMAIEATKRGAQTLGQTFGGRIAGYLSGAMQRCGATYPTQKKWVWIPASKLFAKNTQSFGGLNGPGGPIWHMYERVILQNRGLLPPGF